MKAVDLISLSELERCIIKRKHCADGDYQMTVKDYDLKITPATQGAYKYPCIKLTFGAVKAVAGGGYIMVFLTEDYMFFSISLERLLHSRKLTFEKSAKQSDTDVVYGSYAAKISCNASEYKTFSEYEGKYKIHHVGADLFYVKLSEKF